MYLNDHSRSAFYELLGLNTTQFNRHVIIETNKTTERIFPEVPDTDDPSFWPRMDRLVELNTQLAAVSKEGGALAGVKRVPIIAGFAANLLGLWFGQMRRSGVGRPGPECGAGVLKKRRHVSTGVMRATATVGGR